MNIRSVLERAGRRMDGGCCMAEAWSGNLNRHVTKEDSVEIVMRGAGEPRLPVHKKRCGWYQLRSISSIGLFLTYESETGSGFCPPDSTQVLHRTWFALAESCRIVL